jgi:AraC-like DNA-binding protein/quercetin dioxygenase-like cupin family protein
MKVYPFKIPKKPKENIIFQIDKGNRFYDKLHQHEEIQLSYIISGKGKLVVGNSVTTFSPNDFIAIGANVPHLFLSPSDAMNAHMVSIFFTKASFGETFFDNQELLTLLPLWSRLPFGFKVRDKKFFIKELFYGLNNANKFQLFIKLLELLHYLSSADYITIIQSPYTVKINKNQGQRLQLVFDYAMQHFQSEIRLDDVAQRIYLSKNAFCRFFKQRTNKTFFQFLAEIRIQHACELIDENPEAPISEIAIESGYQTISNFNRQFGEITKMNPSEYRRKFINGV